MADYHTTYTAPEGETTEWDVLQRKYGNLPPAEPTWKPAGFAPTPDASSAPAGSAAAREAGAARVDAAADAEGLDEMEDEFDDDRFMESYRRKRIAEMAAAVRKPRFGSVEPLAAPEFVQKVTNAGPDLWVVVHLFKDSSPHCGLMAACLDELAKMYSGTKFLKIVSTECIPGYPDRNLPTLLLYRNGAVVKHIVGLGVFGGHRATPEGVALVLNNFGGVCVEGGGAGNAGEEGEEGGEGGVGGAGAREGVAAAADRLRRSVLEKLLAAKEGGGDAGGEDD